MWESPRLSFFVIEVFGTNAQPASGRCRLKGVWAQPNKHFEFGFEKSDSKIASWYQLALLATIVLVLRSSHIDEAGILQASKQSRLYSYIFPKFFDRRYSNGDRPNCFLKTDANLL